MTKEQSNINSIIFEQYKQQGIMLYGERGKFAYDSWNDINKAYFNNKLIPIQITWGITPYSKSKSENINGLILLHNSIYNRKNNTLYGKKYTYDIILHEAIHHYIINNGGYTQNCAVSSNHNNIEWITEIIRIGGLLGYNIKADIIKQKRINGKVSNYVKEGYLTRKEIASFPISIRSTSYYTE